MDEHKEPTPAEIPPPPPPMVVLSTDSLSNSHNSSINDAFGGLSADNNQTRSKCNGPLQSPILVQNASVDLEFDDKFTSAEVVVCPKSSNSRSSSVCSLGQANQQQQQQQQLTAICSSNHYCSPNPSPPPIIAPAAMTRISSTRVQGSIGGGSGSSSSSCSAARMFSSLLKQQNSIAEEECDDEQLPLAAHNNNMVNSGEYDGCCQTPPSNARTTSIGGGAGGGEQKCWLTPPAVAEHSVSPPPSRMAHPIDNEMVAPMENGLAMSGHHPPSQHQQNATIKSVQLGRSSVALATPLFMGLASPSAAAAFARSSIYHQQPGRSPELPNECGKGRNSAGGWSRQQSQPCWFSRQTGSIVNNNKNNRKGSLSPNNSLRYNTLMAATVRRSNFQQQRTTSEATPAQRDQLMADVLGNGIREQCISASVSAPSPRLLASSTADNRDGSKNSLLRFELGGGGTDSSASSLNNPPAGQSCSQCSSAGGNSLHHVGSIKNKTERSGSNPRATRRQQTITANSSAADCCAAGSDRSETGSASGSLPKLVALVPSAFPPTSMLLSSDALNQPSDAQREERKSAKQSLNLKEENRGDESTTMKNATSSRTLAEPKRAKRTAEEQRQQDSPSYGQTLFPPSPAVALFCGSSDGSARNPAKWNLTVNKQRSSSESAFFNVPKRNGASNTTKDCNKCCCCKHCQCEQRNDNGAEFANDEGQSASSCFAVKKCAAGESGKGVRRTDSLGALGSSVQRRCSAIALILNQHREHAILQRILGPTGLGWIKQTDSLKKSLSLVLNENDLEAQRRGSAANVGRRSVGTGHGLGGGAGGGGDGKGADRESERGEGGGSLVFNDESNCSVKQPLVMESKERGGRFIKRQQLYNKRRVTSDYALFSALFGIVLMILQNELVYAEHPIVCTILKSFILISTIVLVCLVVKFHVHEIQIFMNANSAEDWKIALTCRKICQIFVEILACAICPSPIQLDVYVSTVNLDGQTIPMRMPLDVLFSILMFFRLYWLCRVMLLHSRLFTDAASRSIAGLNRVKTDAKFILKTLMTICPGTVLMLFTASLWIIGGYILRLCERNHDVEEVHLNVHAEKHQSYLNSLWLIAVTFLSIGYGDIVPNTQCGRIMAVVTGILGTCTSSMVVAVIARKLELTRAEKHVHNFMIETQHTKEMKHIAANVLIQTWLIYKNRRLVDRIDPSKIRYHQRKFLVAICALRKLKTSQRKLDENRVSLGDVAKTTSHSHELMRDSHEMMREVQGTQEGMALRITAVEHQLADIRQEIGCITEMLKATLRRSPAIEY